MGAGGGGFLLFYCAAHARQHLRESMAQEGLREMNFEFDLQGAKVLMNA
jgi:galactokinase/mevalonate kinase-like predicted kinase